MVRDSTWSTDPDDMVTHFQDGLGRTWMWQDIMKQTSLFQFVSGYVDKLIAFGLG